MMDSPNTDKVEEQLSAVVAFLGNELNVREKELIEKAFEQSKKIYANKVLSNGDPALVHYLEVGKIAVYEIGLRSSTFIAAMLHGQPMANEDHYGLVQQEYGHDVAVILKGFKKISDLPTTRLSYQSDPFRKLFLSLVEDIRVVLLKIAHRLYDMRYPELLDAEKLQRFVEEVKYLYIPITHRLGLYSIKAEFEERVMRYEYPEVFESIQSKINADKENQEVFMKAFIAPVERELKLHGIESNIKWRTKSIPSIWAKMKDQNVEFEQVYDLFAIRIITKSQQKKEKEDCWRAYSIVSDLYTPNPKRLRDWITTPKASGYESLHTTVKAADDKWVEVQIRSDRMDRVAEKGQAAHWLYKDKPEKKDAEEWLNQVRDVLENPGQIQFDAYKKAGKHDGGKIFIFTPDGDLKQLPAGSSVLDFAYEVHTKVGDRCSGARVNNRNVPIRHLLQNGDKVEIITNKKQVPKHDWLSIVVTDRAKSKIKRYLKEVELKEAEFGKELLLRKLKNWKIVYSEDIIHHLVKHYKKSTSIQLYHDVATEKLDLMELKKHLVLLTSEDKHSTKPIETAELNIEPKAAYKTDGKDDFLIIDDSLSNVIYKLAKCCNPIPGDDVFGFVTISTGITIHRVGCPNAARLKERYGYRVLKVRWKESKDNPNFQAAIRVIGIDTLGLVGEITQLISNDLKVNMRTISFDTRDGRFIGKIGLQIKDTDHLEQLIFRIGKVQGVEKVTRID